MSIKDFWDKIKSSGETFLGDERAFFSVLLVVVSLLSFQLGQYAMLDTSASQSAQVEGYTKDHIDIEKEGVVASVYVASKNGTRYHLPWCSGARRIAEENKVWFSDKEAAERAGYTPAQNCDGI